ncbi:MAG TPA: hypothetical protein VEG60_05180 [Candidatus Binatia bacterium]|nr:hypothetical protein [Candidatus Binatia bacterium]
MSTDIIRNQTPEELELQRKQAELESLEADLIQRELDLANLRAELTEFESRYLRTVGVLYAELDEIEAQIAEAQARRRPDARRRVREISKRSRSPVNEQISTSSEATLKSMLSSGSLLIRRRFLG